VLLLTWRPPLTIAYLWDEPVKNLQMTLGPALALGIALAAMMARITRSSVLEVLGEDFVRTARAKSLREAVVVRRHALINAMLPIMTVTGTELGALLGSSVAVERAFGVPGLGLALVFAVAERDWMLIQNLVLLYGVIFVLINLVVDVSYGWLSVKELAYVEAAGALGASGARVMARHVAPQCVAPFLIITTGHLGAAICIEAALSFVGVGVPPPTPSWGNMLGGVLAEAFKPPWWMVVFPGTAITVTILAVNLFGDALRDFLGPKLT
jgi:ABC-type dipeptide/oligopeptide/nickel transport system permease component